MSTAPAVRLAVVTPGGRIRAVSAARRAPDDPRAYRSHLSGVAVRYLDGLADEASRRGWPDPETLGLLAAVEQRSRSWRILASRFGSSRVERVPGSRTGIAEVYAAASAAATRSSVCLAGASGAGVPGSVLDRLAAAGARVGGLLAESAPSPWAIEVAVVPAIAPDLLVSLREQLTAAPRCGWCRIPVLGTACHRCTGTFR